MRSGIVGLVSALWVGLMLLALPASADQRDVVVGVEELDYFPAYAFRDGQYTGAGREILDAFAADRGYRLTYRALPIKRLVAELLSGGVTLKFPDNPNWGLDQKKGQMLAYSSPVISYVDGVMVVPDKVGKGPDAIRTLGTVAGFTPFAWLERVKSGTVQVKENSRFDPLLRQAVMGRLDGAYISVAVASYTLEKMGMPGALVFDPGLPHSRDSYRLSSLARPELVAEFDAWLSANSARVKAIKDRFGAERGVE